MAKRPLNDFIPASRALPACFDALKRLQGFNLPEAMRRPARKAKPLTLAQKLARKRASK